MPTPFSPTPFDNSVTDRRPLARGATPRWTSAPSWCCWTSAFDVHLTKPVEMAAIERLLAGVARRHVS
jgi:hypothetical protein